MEELAALRHRWMQASAAYPGGPAALAEIRRHLDSLATRGAAHAFHHPDGRLGAALLVCGDPLDTFYQASVTHLIAQHDGSLGGKAWLAVAIDTTVPELPDDIECVVPATDAWTRGRLLRAGLGISTVMMAGRVETARLALAEGVNPPLRPEDLGLRVEPMVPSQADEVVELLRRVFTEEPDYAWFMAGDAWLARRREQFAAGGQDRLSLCLRRGDRLLGLIEAGLNLSDPHHGSAVGVGLVLDPSLRGQGLARYAYERVIDLAAEGGAEWIKGSTARPAVLHLAARLGRQPVSVFMRRRPRFDDGRFDGVLGPA